MQEEYSVEDRQLIKTISDASVVLKAESLLNNQDNQ